MVRAARDTRQCLCSCCLCIPGAPLLDDDANLPKSANDASNAELLRKLRQDEHEEQLHDITCTDYEKDRMTRFVASLSQVMHPLPVCTPLYATRPVKACEIDCSRVLVNYLPGPTLW